jgi:hypothetical protein
MPFPSSKMVVLSEASEQLVPSPSARDIMVSSEEAKLSGIVTYYIPQDFSKCKNVGNALWHVPAHVENELSFWIGYIPDLDSYVVIYHAALAKEIKLVNCPEEHRVAQEFDLAYPRLGELTLKNLTVSDIALAHNAAHEIG